MFFLHCWHQSYYFILTTQARKDCDLVTLVQTAKQENWIGILLAIFFWGFLADIKLLGDWTRSSIFPSPLENTDISVECGTSSISLAILVCPVVYTGYNESLLNLNDIFNKPECKGTLDESVSPPVVRFTFPLNMTSACGSKFVVSRAWMRSWMGFNKRMFSQSILYSFVFFSVLDSTVNVASRPPVQLAQGSLLTSPISRRLMSVVWCNPMIQPRG